MKDFLAAISILGPVIEDVVNYIRGGEPPSYLASLPTEIKSRIALERLKALSGDRE